MLELNGEMKATYGFIFDDEDLRMLNERLKESNWEETSFDEVEKLWKESTEVRYEANSREDTIINYLDCYYVCDAQIDYGDDYKRTSSSF